MFQLLVAILTPVGTPGGALFLSMVFSANATRVTVARSVKQVILIVSCCVTIL